MDIRFGAYRLSVGERVLQGPSGPVQIGDRAFQLLKVLLERAHSVVSKEELLDAVWSDLTVEENTLQVHISALRKALGPKIIKTVHGRGYQYAGPPPTRDDRRTGSESEPFDAGSERSKGKKPRLAVLPFENRSRQPDQEMFCAGLAEEIVTALSKLGRLIVIDPTSTRRYRDAAADPRRVGKEQKVDYVLKGSARQAGDRLRVIAQLSDAGSGETIFSDRYDRKIADVFEIQDDITREIVSSLQIKLTDGEQARLWASGTRSLEAWECFIRAAELIDHHVKEDSAEGRRLLEEALRIDPSYAVAWCKLGWVHWSYARHNWTSDPARSLAEAISAAKRAKEIDPTFAEPMALMAMSAMQSGNFAEASGYADQALENASGQSFVLATISMVLAHCGRPIDALDVIREAIALCPIYPDWYQLNLGRSHYLMGNFESAVDALYEIHSRKPDFGHVLLIASLFQLGRRTEASNIVRESLNCGASLSIGKWLRGQSYSDPAIVERIAEILGELNVPE